MLLVAYLLGSLSFAIIVSKFMKMEDPRNYGSNNAGATNVMRSGNKKAAVFTLLGDFLKGLIVVLIARFLMRGIDGGDAIVGICGVLAVIGHIFPIFFKFKGYFSFIITIECLCIYFTHIFSCVIKIKASSLKRDYNRIYDL